MAKDDLTMFLLSGGEILDRWDWPTAEKAWYEPWKYALRRTDANDTKEVVHVVLDSECPKKKRILRKKAVSNGYKKGKSSPNQRKRRENKCPERSG
jgi:hypothetical protein